MLRHSHPEPRSQSALWHALATGTLACIWLSGCGGGDGPAIEARPQSLQFSASPPTVNAPGSVVVAAQASSGLAVVYASATPETCAVDRSTGVVTGLAAGNCTTAADQSGNTTYAPAPQVTQQLTVIAEQSITFGPAPALSLFGTATVAATASSGLPVTYSSLTPGVCTVDGGSGLVTDLLAGDCIIAADQAGDSHYHPAPRQTQTLTVVEPPPVASLPEVPSAVAATLGSTAKTVLVSFGAPNDGGSPITGYRVVSSPAGLSATGAASPVTVTCPVTCAGYAFAIQASNGVGNGALSGAVDVLTSYDVTETFYEPDTQPRDSIFIGSFTFNSTTGKVSNLRGILSESMTGTPVPYPNDTMTWLPLEHQLSAVFDPTLGGLLVTTFMNADTNTLSNNPALGGTNGWAPGSGMGLYYNFPGANPGNAYAMIFVNTTDPTTPLTQAQINKLAYADCAPGGMMGATCMTGTTVAGYGTIGTMSGYPVSQKITKRP